MISVQDYIVGKGFEYQTKHRPSGDNAIFVCPFCDGGPKHEKSFAINLETGAWNCLRTNNCGLSGSFFQLQQRLGDKPEYSFHNDTKQKTYVKPTAKTLPVSANARALAFLRNRGLTGDTVKGLGIRTTSKGEICFAYYFNGEVVNNKYRTLDKKFWQEKNALPCLYNIDAVDPSEPLIITEGELDTASLVQYGFDNVTSLPAGTNNLDWIDTNWNLLEKFSVIYLCMDSDEAGQRAVKVIAERLGCWRCRSVTFPYKDANECLMRSVPMDIMQDCFENANEFLPAGLRWASDLRHEIRDEIRDDNKNIGVPTGFPGLNDFLKGWKPGQVTIWTGACGSGKTTILNQVCLNLVKHNQRSLVASLELKASRYLKWAVYQTAGRSKLTNAEIDLACDWWEGRLLVWDNPEQTDANELFGAFEYAAHRYGVQHFVIDSLMRINMSRSDEYRDQKDFITRVMAFAQKNNCHAHVVCHQRKQSNDMQMPDKNNISGTGNISNLADNAIAVWRVPFKAKQKDGGSPDTMLIVQKNRDEGTEGIVDLWFDTDSKRFTSKNQTVSFMDDPHNKPKQGG